jgi:hypothetical protein
MATWPAVRPSTMLAATSTSSTTATRSGGTSSSASAALGEAMSGYQPDRPEQPLRQRIQWLVGGVEHRLNSAGFIVHREQVKGMRGGEPGNVVGDRALRAGHSGCRQSQRRRRTRAGPGYTVVRAGAVENVGGQLIGPHVGRQVTQADDEPFCSVRTAAS